jgi:DNA invertase Pin-like site-specific DNA recombinase
MATYGLVRSSLAKKDEWAGREMEEIVRRAEQLGGGLKGIFADPGSTDRKTGFLSRSAGKEMLAVLQAGDALIVARLERLGYTMPDILRTRAALADRGVRIHVLRALDGKQDIEPEFAKAVQILFAWCEQTEKALRSERAANLACLRKLDHHLLHGDVRHLLWCGCVCFCSRGLPGDGPQCGGGFERRTCN